MRLEDLNLIVREKTERYKEFASTLSRTIDTTEPLKKLVCRSREDSRFLSLGVALIAFPDPFIVTDIVGSSMIAAELVRRKMREPSIVDMCKEAHRSLAKLQAITEEIIQQPNIKC